MNRYFFVLTSLLCCLALCACQSAPEIHDTLSEEEYEALIGAEDSLDNPQKPEDEGDSKGEKTQVLILGDSTAAWYHTGTGYTEKASEGRDLMGWGYYLSSYFGDEIECVPLAKSGTSSKSFLETENYQSFLDELSQGDYVLLQFSHNDRAKDDRRTEAAIPLSEADENGTNAEGVFSYQGVLYYKYIRPALDAGAIPVLISPTVLRNSVTGDADVSSEQTVYTEALRSLAQSCNIPFADTTASIEELYRTLSSESPENTAKLHAFTDNTRTQIDNTHFSHYGAWVIAGVVANDLADVLSELELFLLETPLPYAD